MKVNINTNTLEVPNKLRGSVLICHPCESRGLDETGEWIPACAGMTENRLEGRSPLFSGAMYRALRGTESLLIKIPLSCVGEGRVRSDKGSP